MDVLEWIQALQGLGVGGLALLFLWLTNKYHVREKEKSEERQREDVKTIRKDYQAIIDQKDAVISELSTRLQTAAEQSRADMERHLGRQVEEVQRLETTIQQNTNAVGGLQDAVKELRAEVRASGT